jgi:site-specific DNA recombinase
MRKPDRPKSGVIFRCAIYTRKSSDDGLEQEFNSLDAQREACEAYVAARSLTWTKRRSMSHRRSCGSRS